MSVCCPSFSHVCCLFVCVVLLFSACDNDISSDETSDRGKCRERGEQRRRGRRDVIVISIIRAIVILLIGSSGTHYDRHRLKYHRHSVTNHVFLLAFSLPLSLLPYAIVIILFHPFPPTPITHLHSHYFFVSLSQSVWLVKARVQGLL